MIRDNHLYKKQPNRYLKKYLKHKEIRGLEPVTVCIAAITNVGVVDKDKKPVPLCIVFCADKLVSAGIEFESIEPKIRRITDYCYAMSSGDAFASDLILRRVTQKIGMPEKTLSIEDIVKIISKECFDYKKEWYENNILWKYNLVFEAAKTTPESLVRNAVKDVEDYEYPLEFEFIVLGLEPSEEAHIFWMNQNGAYQLRDSLGFTTIGIGAQLAFPQMTKYGYSRYLPLISAIPIVYISKKVSERMQGVGQNTDLIVLHNNRTQEKPFAPMLWIASSQPDFMKQLDDAYLTIMKNETAELQNISQKVQEWLSKAPKSQSQASS